MVYQYIQDVAQFNQVQGILCAEKMLGIDTEFVRKQTFWPLLSLIQFATEQDVYIIEPSVLPRDWLQTLLLNPHITKIFHSCRQDIEALYAFCGVVPKNIFDTQIGAAFLGLGEQISYADLTKTLVHIELSKDQQWTDWAKRPLSEEQLSYAANDARYLIDVYQQLKSALQAQDRWLWVEDIMTEQAVLSAHTTDPDQYFIERIYTSNMVDTTANALHALTLWRELYCRKHNIIRSQVIDDSVMRQLTPRMRFDEHFLSNNPLRQEIHDVLQKPARVTPQLFWISPPLGHAIKAIKKSIEVGLQAYKIPRKYLATQKNIIDFLMFDTPDNPMLHTWRGRLMASQMEDLRAIQRQFQAQQNQGKNCHKNIG